jgi:hypothetical protein
MNNQSKITIKSFSPLLCIVGSSILAGIIGIVISLHLLSGFLKEDSLGFGALVAPFFVIFTFVVFFFYVWSPILAISLIACGIIQLFQRSANVWVWICACVVWGMSLPPFYCAVWLIRDSPVLAKY